MKKPIDVKRQRDGKEIRTPSSVSNEVPASLQPSEVTNARTTVMQKKICARHAVSDRDRLRQQQQNRQATQSRLTKDDADTHQREVTHPSSRFSSQNRDGKPKKQDRNRPGDHPMPVLKRIPPTIGGSILP